MEQDPKEIDLSKILLPQKDKDTHIAENAQRTSAGVLFDAEKTAGEEGIPKTPEETAAAITPVPAAVPAAEDTSTQPLETYRGDIEKVVKQKNVSVVSIAAAEAQARGSQAGVAPDEKAKEILLARAKSMALLLLGILFIAGAVGLVAWVYIARTASIAVHHTGDIPSPLIGVDYTKIFAIQRDQMTRATLMTQLDSERQSAQIPLGLMERFYITEASSTQEEVGETIPASQLLSLLAPSIPQNILRTADPQAYVIGVHSFDGTQAFLLLSVDSYEQAFSGMLQWEATLERDLLPLFVRNLGPKLPREGATSTPEAPQLLSSQFSDRVVLNHDARVLVNTDGDILLLWTFLDKKTLLITTNEATMREVVSRFASAPSPSLP